jgi:hypothetical protein
MIPNRIKIPKVEFYITNVCNLTCEDCNRFNNHDFKGWQAWDDFKETYQQWSQYVELDQVVILGGEPLLNPTLIDWIKGINQLWQCNVQILSNGTRINHVHGLYEVLSTIITKANGTTNKNFIGISIHNQSYLEEFEQELAKFVTGPLQKLDKNHFKNRHNADFLYTDGHIRIPIWIQDKFSSSAIKIQSNGKFTLHSSDPADAHAICPIAQYKSYHFIRGKLYKCGPVALFPEFDQQHEFDISPEDRTLLNSYKPLAIEEFETLGQEFLNNIDNPIPQCKFCPAQNNSRKILSIRKGL